MKSPKRQDSKSYKVESIEAKMKYLLESMEFKNALLEKKERSKVEDKKKKRLDK